VVTGDITQIDLPKGQSSGLVEVQKVLRDVEGAAFVHLTGDDVIRHPMVQKIIEAYERYEAKTSNLHKFLGSEIHAGSAQGNTLLRQTWKNILAIRLFGE